MVPVLVLVLAAAAVATACIFVVARDRRRRELREQAYPDHVWRRVQARREGVDAGDEARSGVDRPPWLAQETDDEDDRTDRLVGELCAIGRGRGFLTWQGEKDRRTREIGAELDRIDGMQRMRDAHSAVRAELGPAHARHLEAAWDGVGSWLG